MKQTVEIQYCALLLLDWKNKREMKQKRPDPEGSSL